MSMQVVFIAAECEPWAKTGGLADVVDALARALGHVPGLLDAPVEVFLPAYSFVKPPAGRAGDVVPVVIPDGDQGLTEVAVRSWDADGYRLRLVDHPACFERAGIYGDGPAEYPDNARRFALLGRAALEARRQEGRPVDVIALHDWHACPTAILRDEVYAGDPVVGGAAITLTIHNPAYHGWTPRDRAAELGLGEATVRVGDAWGVDLLGEGIRRAELVNTVSPTYAREVLTPDAGMGLDGDLRALGDRLVGILNGLDRSVWDPATDAALAATYDAAERTGKAACRRDLLERVGFDPADQGPVLGVVGRLDPQKGFDLVAAAAPGLLARGARDRGARERRPLARRRDALAGGQGAGPARHGRAVRPGPGSPDLRRGGHVPHAVPVRAVRTGPDDRDALWHAARGAGDRRPDRHDHRPGCGSRPRDRVPVRRADRRGAHAGRRPGRGRPG